LNCFKKEEAGKTDKATDDLRATNADDTINEI